MMTGSEERDFLESRIVSRLGTCDEDTLIRIDDMLDPADATVDGESTVLFSGGITRRQFLAAAAAGGATVVFTNAGTAVVAGSLGARAGEAKAELVNQVELLKLRGLLSLYENLEQVGIDALLSTGIAALTLSVDGLELGISALQSGVSLVDRGVSAIESAFPTIRTGLSLAERLITSIENRVKRLQELMTDVQEVVSPLSDAVGSFFSSLVERIPGVGPTIVDTLDRISELVGSLPETIGKVRSDLLEPLREDWFTDDEETGLKGTLLNPLQEDLLEPLETFLGDLVDAIDGWQGQLVTPVKDALIRRDTIKGQIAEYKEQEEIQ